MKKIIFTTEEIEDIKNLYEKGETTRSIGKKYNVSSKVTSNLLKINNVKIRSSGQQYKGGKKVADKKYHLNNKEKLSKYYKDWCDNNKEHRKEYMKNYRTENYDNIKQTKRTYERNRKSTDPLYRLIGNFRTAIYTVLKENNVKKYGHYFEILGYTQEDLIKHLEKQFKNGMTWDNYGDWHVDHKRPITSFIFKDISDEEFKKCWSLENLQPMWGSENISKSNHYEI